MASQELSTGGRPGAPGGAQEPKNTDPNDSKVLLQGIRLAHNQADSNRRIFTATVTQAKSHPNTQASRVVDDLHDMIVELTKLDGTLLEYESKVHQGNLHASHRFSSLP